MSEIDKPKKSMSMCFGCYNNDYNFGLGGAKQCWSFKSAKVKKKIQIHINERPPYNLDSWEYKLDCYNRKQFVHVDPSVLTSSGYWKR